MITREDIKNNPGLLTQFITDFTSSVVYKKMETSDKYYNLNNEDIMGRRNMMWLDGQRTVQNEDGEYSVQYIREYKEDRTKANNKVPHGFHYELVNQCKNFLAGHPVKVTWKHTTPDDQFKEELDRVLNQYNNWGVFNQTMIKDAQKYSRAFARVVIHPKTKEIRFIPVSPLTVIPFYDDFGDLYMVIRTYVKEELTAEGILQEKNYAEVIDHVAKDIYNMDGEPEHIEEEVLLKEVTQYGHVTKTKDSEWGRIPIIEWRFTDDGINALEPIKPFLDLADANISDFANDLDDINELIWIVKNYNGQDIGEFMSELKEKKAIRVGEDGDVRAERNELPYKARKELYDIIVRNIYRFGRGIDFTDRSNLGNITGTGLKWSYELLEEKANELEQNGQKALDNLFYFIFKWMNMRGHKNDYDATNVEFLFDRSLMVNEAEMMNNTLKFTQFGSLETALEHNNWVDDVDEELKRINDSDDSWEDLLDDRRTERDSDSEEVTENISEVKETITEDSR